MTAVTSDEMLYFSVYFSRLMKLQITRKAEFLSVKLSFSGLDHVGRH